MQHEDSEEAMAHVPFPWMEYAIYALIALVVIAAIVYFYMRYKKREIKIFTPKIPEF